MVPTTSTILPATTVSANGSMPPISGISTVLVQQFTGRGIDPSNLTLAQGASLQRLNSLPLNTGARKNLAYHIILGMALDESSTIWKLEFKDINNRRVLEAHIRRDSCLVATLI